MTEKRFIYCFEGIEDKWETVEEYKYTPCTKDGFQDLCVMLNELNDENEELKSRVEYLERKIDRERTSYQKQHEKWEEEIQKENEQLKSKNRGLQSELQIFKEDATHSNLQINKLADENEVIRNTINEMYKNERTQLGKSVLKQLLNNIEVIQ